MRQGTLHLVILGSVVPPSPLLLHKSGTTYPLLSESHHHLIPSNVTSKLSTMPRHNILTTEQLPCTSDIIFYNFGAAPNFSHYTEYITEAKNRKSWTNRLYIVAEYISMTATKNNNFTVVEGSCGVP